jgi:hypothetical protein
MSRITVRNVESSLNSFNTMLGLPTEYSVDGVNQQGHVFLQQQNGYNNIYQHEGAGARGLAYGLTLRQAHEWISAAMQGIQIAKGVDTSR